MGLFKKSSQQQAVRVAPIQTKFDQEWFAAWGDRIFAESGIDEDDPQNQRGLVLKLMRLMGYWGQNPMKLVNDQSALQQFEDYMGDPESTPWGAMSFIAGWATSVAGAEEQVTPAIEMQLEKAQGELIMLASKNGNLHDNWNT